MKYVTFKENSGAVRFVLFSDHLVHADMADWVCRGVRRGSGTDRSWLQPRSAGFYNPMTQEASGESESLGIGSLASDAAYITLGDSCAFADEDMAIMLHVKLKMALTHGT